MIVYVATCSVNGKQYVGITTGRLSKRVYLHRRDAQAGRRTKIARAIRRHGIARFDFKVVRQCVSLPELYLNEMAWVQKLDTYASGYNSTLGGEGGHGVRKSDAAKRHYRRKAYEWQERFGDWGSYIRGRLATFFESDEGKRQLARRREVANRVDVQMKMSRAHGGKPVEAWRDGELVGVYHSQGACARALGIRQGNLWGCLNGRSGYRSASGYTFRYSDACDSAPADTATRSCEGVAAG